MSKQKIDWLTFFSSEIACSENFLAALDQQLVEQAYSQTGINIRRGFCLAPDNSNGIGYDKDNIAYLEADLVGPDNFGHAVVISWRCEAHLNRQILPSDQLSPAHEYQLKIWWYDLPVEDLSKYSQPAPALISGSFSFIIEWKWTCWPEVYLELQTKQPLLQGQIEAVESVLDKLWTEWNYEADKHGLIHNWHGLRHVDTKKYQMSIDFGSTDLIALSHWLETLENLNVNQVLSIIKVIVCSASSQLSE